jgi:mitochondrial ATPase complex subunit ATP10
MQRGYFDDFRDFRDSQGKVFHSPTRLIPAAAAPLFPQITPLTSDGTPVSFPFTGPSAPAASLVCIAFRAGAQEMIEAWAEPFSRTAASQLKDSEQGEEEQQQPLTSSKSSNKNFALVELALIESVVMGIWPFRNILMKNGGASQGKYAMPATYLYHFVRDTETIRNALQMTNRLTGYIYLLDSLGRVRWRGSGNPSSIEIEMLLQCSYQLLEEKEKEKGGAPATE